MDFFERISEADIISFDIFDTLIVRPYIKPTDLFKHIEYAKSYEGSKNIKGFYEDRIKGEAKARKELVDSKKKQEISIDDIYNFMDKKYFFLKEVEMNWEIMICKANPIMLDIYNKLIKLGKKIIFTSDMYLPLSIIKKILHNSQFGDHPIYLSSELNLTKCNNSIYYKILQDYKGKKIIHIGDNFFTDIINARLCGVNAQYVVKPLDYFLSQDYVSPFIRTLAESDDIAASLIVGLNLMLWLNNYTNTPKTDEDKALNLGRAEAFSLLVPFVQWLNKNITKKNNNNNLYFFSRSGQILQKIYSILYPESKSDYLYISRKIAISLMAVYDYDVFIFYVLCHINYENKEEAITTIYNNIGIHHPKFLDDLKNIKNINKTSAKSILQKYKKDILKLLEENNSVYMHYLDSKNFLDRNTQSIVVDTGWSGTIQESISIYLRYNHYSIAENLQGYYIGLIDRKYTHFNYDYNKNFYKYIPNHIIEKYYHYIVPLVELFTYHSDDTTCVSMEEKDNKFIPIFAPNNQYELHKCRIANYIQKGIIDILDLYKSIFGNYHIPQPSFDILDICFSSIVDKSNHSSYSFIWDLSETRNISATDTSPVYKPNSAKPGIVLHYAWGNAPSGELELIYKFKRIEQNLGITVYVVDDNNFLFDNNGNLTQNQLNTVDKNIFMYLELHMTSFKKLDTLSSMALVNPPEFIMKWNPIFNNFYYRMASHNLYMFNGSNNNLNFVKNYLNNKGLFSKELVFYPSCSEKDILPPPDLNNPKIFYITTNWTAWENLETRYESLLFLLDTSAIPCAFYGPKVVNGIEVWHGVKNYRGSLPFDGISTLKAINECGVCICFSSEVHLHWESVSSRLYEAIAGGAIAIVDNNPFIKEKFGNSVLYVNTNLSDKAVFLQIEKHINYIKANQDYAVSMILEAQKILRKEFVFERQIENWISKLPEVKNNLSIQTHSQTTDTIDIILVILHESIGSIQQSMQNINDQINIKLRVIIVYDNTLEILLNTILNCMPSHIEIIKVPMDIFSCKLTFNMYLGEIIDSIKHYITSKYFYVYLVERYIDCTLFHNHITTLVRSLEDNEEVLAVTGSGSIDILPEHNMIFSHPMYSYKITSVIEQKALLINTVFKSILLKQLDLLKYFHSLFDLYMFDKCSKSIIFNTEITSRIQINKNQYYSSININNYNTEKSFLNSIAESNYQFHIETKIINSVVNTISHTDNAISHTDNIVIRSTPKYHNTIMIGKYKILSYRKLSNFMNLIKKEKVIRIGKYKILSYRKLSNFIHKIFH